MIELYWEFIKSLIELWALREDWKITDIGRYMSELSVDVQAHIQVYCTTLLQSSKLVFKWALNFLTYSYGVK